MQNNITFSKKFFSRITSVFFIFFLSTVSILAQAPIANDDVGEIDEDNGGVIATLSDNDADTDGGSVVPSSIILIDPSNPGNTGSSGSPLVLSTGTFTIDAAGTLSYTPTLNFNGTAIVNYTIEDNDLNVSAPGVVTITVNSVNDAPVLGDDTGNTTNEDTQLSVGNISSNATDVDGTIDASSIVLIDPGNGSNTGQTGSPLIITGVGIYTVDASGNLTYDPATNYNGAADINYTIEDNGGAVSNEATVYITVSSVNDAPVLGDDTGNTTNEDTQLSVGNISSNATDVDGTIDASSIVLIDPGNGSNTGQTGSPLIITGVGTYTVDASGNLTYDPATNYYGTANINYTIEDNEGAVSNKATVYITVSSVNDAPVLGDDTGNTTNEDTQLSVGNISSNATDEDGTIDASSIVLIDPGNGSNTGQTGSPLIITGVGTYTVDASGNLTYDPATNYNGAADINYTIEDNGGAVSNEATVFITVSSVNDAPVLGDDTGNTTNEDTQLSVGNISSNATDVDGTIDASSIVLIDPGNGSNTGQTGSPLIISGVGTYTVDASGNLTYDPATNYNGTADINYTIEDNEGAVSNEATVYITVSSDNDPPVSGDDSYSVDENGTLTVVLPGILTNDTDQENDDLTAQVVDEPDYGVLALNADGSFVYEHDGSNFVQDVFTYVANDGTTNGNVATVTITVNQQNDPPVSEDDSYTVIEGGTLNVGALLGVLANDTDDEDDTFTEISLERNVVNGTLTLNNDGSFQYIHDGSETLIDSFRYSVSDGENFGDYATARISITSQNDAPISTNDVYYLNEGATRAWAAGAGVLANDSDPDGDDISVVLELVTEPNHGTVVVALDGSFAYEHDGSESTRDSFRYVATDGILDGNLATARIIIQPVNDPPYFQNFTNIDRYEGSDTTYTILSNFALDDDSPLQDLTFSRGTPYPSNFNTYINYDTLFIAPINENWYGSEEMYIHINDNDPSHAEETRDTIMINVTNVDDRPRFTNEMINVTASDEDTGVEDVLINIDTDVIELDGDELNLVAADDAIFSFTISYSEPRYLIEATVPDDWYGERDIEFYIVDNTPQQLRDTIVLHYTVTPVDDPPYLSNPISNLYVLEDADSIVYNLHNVFNDIDNADEDMAFNLYNSNDGIVEAYISDDDELVLKFVEDKNTSGYYGSTPNINLTCTSNGESVNNLFSVSVNPVNDPPTFVVSGDVIIFGNETTQYREVTVTSDEVPIDEPGIVSYSLTPASVNFANVSINEFFGTVSITVPAGSEGYQEFTIIANDNEDIAMQTFQLSVNVKAEQTIIFNSIPHKDLSDTIVLLEATASSMLPISFSLVGGPASISNDTLFIQGAGHIVVRASQAGNEFYNPAPDVDRSFDVLKLPQEITFEEITDKTFGDEDFELNATSTSELDVYFSVEYGPVSFVDDTILQIDGVGEVKVVAHQDGNSEYEDADTVSHTFEIYKADQTLQFNELGNQIFSPSPILLSATSTSGLPVSFSVISGSANIQGNSLNVTGAGYITVRALQNGNEYYNPANYIDQTIEIYKASQTITFNEISDTTYGSFDISLTTTTSSGIPAEFIVQGPVEITDTLLSISGTGMVYVSAFQPGDERYLPTDTITRSFEITKADQSIDLDEPDPIVYGLDEILISAEASSGLSLTLEIISGPANAIATTIDPNDYGEVFFRVLQEGNENYNPTSINYTITFVKSVHDIALVKFLSPNSWDEVAYGRPTPIKVRVKNTGNREMESFNIAYVVSSESNSNPSISEYYPSSLFPGDSIDYSFSNIWTPRETHQELCVFLQSGNDDVITNDTICLPLISSINPLAYNKDLMSNVYPIPANNFVYFSIGENHRQGRLIIFNTSGAVIEEFEIETDANKVIFEVDVNRYRQGTYYYKYINDHEFVSGKFIVY